uniref:Protein m135 n=1 Tax=Mastomys natalensis cytomegalovirus 1 TaxID=2973541 RepID=A0A9Y1IL99_9BETA|nr:protein m135 [Mastomys natalensis cytomegalovirus 1]WEG68984.1 protein m135 [Mastomys natalensis cytomegalovirus 1]WEG71212.1 protein m135 [Mastomys natalensis cytomegalovirus 1]
MLIKMNETDTKYYTTTEIISAQLIVVAVVTVTSVLLLIAILAITISTAVERYCKKTSSNEAIECRLYLVQESGRVIGTMISETPLVQSTLSPGTGYEDMNVSIRHEDAYESVN